MSASLRAVFLSLIFVAAGLPAAAQSAPEFAARARQLSDEGRHAEAAQSFERAIERAPRRRDEWLSEYADQLAFSGAAEAAIPLYREVVTDATQPEEKRDLARRRLAFALFWSWNLEEAVPALRSVSEEYPDDEEVREALQRATAALADVKAGARRLAALEPLWSGDYFTAIPALRELLKEKPADAELRRSLADALAGAARLRAEGKDYVQAVSLFDEAADVDPSRADQFALQEAEQLLYGGQWNEAESRFLDLLNSFSVSEETQHATLLGLARTYAWSGQSEDAVPVYDALLADDPTAILGLIGRGQVLADLGEFRASRSDFLQVLQVDPGNIEAIRGRSRAMLGLERPREALVQLAPLLAVDDPDPNARLLAARAHQSMGRPDLAKDLARDLIAEGEFVEEAYGFIESLLLEQMPLATLEATHAWQSDGLRVTNLRGQQARVYDNGLTRLSFEAGVTRFRGENFPDADLARIGVSGSRRIGEAFEVRGAAFLNFRETQDSRSRSGTFEAGLAYFPNDDWRFGLSWQRRYAGDTSRAVVKRIVA
ncbi:hypothetical protein, partial [Paracoccus sp. (in: a-proteobacteria)]|uniref:tetratricopeptide repeat protein n=1 Tax=Paracoccus sp. TaxID=267 RepID=UPI00396CB4B8